MWIRGGHEEGRGDKETERREFVGFATQRCAGKNTIEIPAVQLGTAGCSTDSRTANRSDNREVKSEIKLEKLL